MSTPRSRRFASIALCVSLGIAAPSGCANRARNELYRQKMANEIRVLEDQLYEADYQNKVLVEKLQRYQQRVAIPAPKVPVDEVPDEEFSPPLRPQLPSRRQPQHSRSQQPDPLELPSLDDGEPMDPEALIDPAAPSELPAPADLPDDPEPLDNPGKLLPAPGLPQPPGKRDLEIPQIEPGEILPPPADPQDSDKPPGQIQLPDTIQASAAEPAALRLHPSLSGVVGDVVPASFDSQSSTPATKIRLVANVVDSLGRTVDLSQFDVDAELTVVILDPQREPSAARLGRWQYDAAEVAQLVQSEPISGLYVPIEWQKLKPQGDEVIVHLRLRSEGDEMRCEGRVRLDSRPATDEWTPRGDEKPAPR